MQNERTCCFIGHRDCDCSRELKERLYNTVENLILTENTGVFLFGSRSRFNDLCLDTVTGLKAKYPHIRRVYVRAEYPEITADYENYLHKFYDRSYYPPRLVGAGRAVYLERNQIMIDQSDVCVFYYSATYEASGKSGTRIAYNYAIKSKKHCVNVRQG